MHGPRGIAINDDGTTWIVDAGYRGIWADRTNGSFRAGNSVSVAQMANGDFLANQGVANWLVRFAPDGTPKDPIILRNLPVPAQLQAQLGTVVTINFYGVAIDPVNGNIYVSPVHYAFDEVETTANERRGGIIVLNPESTATPAFVGEPVRAGFTFAGWSPAVADTVTASVTYYARYGHQWFNLSQSRSLNLSRSRNQSRAQLQSQLPRQHQNLRRNLHLFGLVCQLRSR